MRKIERDSVAETLSAARTVTIPVVTGGSQVAYLAVRPRLCPPSGEVLRRVESAMIASAHDGEIFRPVVERVSVDVMDDFFWRQLSSKHLFHDETVFVHPSIRSFGELDFAVRELPAMGNARTPNRTTVAQPARLRSHSPSPIFIAMPRYKMPVAVNPSIFIELNGRKSAAPAPTRVLFSGSLTFSHSAKDTYKNIGVKCPL